MMGKSLILVILAFLCVVQCRRPSMRDFSRGMKLFQRDHGTLYRSEDDEDYRRQKDPMRSVNKFARNDEDEMTKAEEMMDAPSDMESPSDLESPMSDEGEETFDGRSDMDLPLEEDDDVEEILASDEGENQTTQPPTEPSTTEAATTEAPSTTTEAPSTTTESTTTTTESTTTTTAPSSTSPPIAPSPGGLSEELAQALKGLSSKVAKQEKFCSYLMEKLQDRIYGSLQARIKEIEASVMKFIGDIQVGRKRSASSLLENLLGQLRDLRIKMRNHRS